MELPKIKIIATGGTICKIYTEDRAKYIINTDIINTIIKEDIYKYNYIQYDFCQINDKDSLDMSPQELIDVADYCENNTNGYKHIIITHGTDRMQDTARLIGERNLDKTIVLVGSMTPYTDNKSDSVTNLSAALVFCQLLPKGVYICCHGVVFPYNNVTKNIRNKTKKEIEEIEPMFIPNNYNEWEKWYSDLMTTTNK